MCNEYIVSIIVPTHNRYRYASATVRSLLSLPDQVEVVVSDTSDDTSCWREFQEQHATDRLKIIRHAKPMSVVDNFNSALQYATGRYLVFIGDDDFVSDQILQVAEWAEKHDVDSLKFTFPVLYYWPDFIHKRKGHAFSSKLIVSEFSGAVSILDPKAELQHALNNFGGGVMDMPRAYAGMISAQLVSRITEKYGSLFGGVSPDIYSAALISVESRKCVKIDFPIIIPGASGASTAGLSAMGRHRGGLRDNPHIGAFNGLVWDSRIPEFYSVPTVWSFSLLKALEASHSSVPDGSFARLYIKCLFYDFSYRKAIQESLSVTFAASPLRAAVLLTSSAFKECGWIVNKIRSIWQARIKRSRSQALSYDGVDDAELALVTLTGHLGRHAQKITLPESI